MINSPLMKDDKRTRFDDGRDSHRASRNLQKLLLAFNAEFFSLIRRLVDFTDLRLAHAWIKNPEPAF